MTELPPGHEIVESINGVVSLAKAVPPVIKHTEAASVNGELAKHSHLRRYRTEVRKSDIIVYEPSGVLSPEIGFGLSIPQSAFDGLVSRARYDPVMRFRLIDGDKRTFTVERMCYRGSVDGWLDLHDYGPINRLAAKYVKHCGKEFFFELY